MGRWIAIGKAPGWNDPARFTQELKGTDKWRVDPRTTITTVFSLDDGRLMAECHAPSKAEFEEWLKKSGWTVESLAQIQLIAKTGDIWKG